MMTMRREHRFGLVMSSYERKLLRDLADWEGMSQGAMLRHLVRLAAREKSRSISQRSVSQAHHRV